MPYELNARQMIAYTDRFDVYRSTGMSGTGVFKDDETFSVTPVYKMVPCLWMNHPDINSYKAPLGRELSESADVLDVIHFPIGCQIKEQDCLRLRTPGHPQNGEWFIVMGFGAARAARGNRQGNYLEVKVKRMLAAPGLEGV